MGWLLDKISNYFITRKIKKFAEKPVDDKVLIAADQYLKDSMLRNKKALDTADRLSRANLLNMQTRQINEDAIDLVQDNEGNYEEDETDSADDMLLKLITTAIMPKTPQSNEVNSSVNDTRAQSVNSASAVGVAENTNSDMQKLVTLAKQNGLI